MADKNWKAVERKVAALFGTKRIPPAVFGQRSDRGNNAPDAETDRLAIQIKDGYAFPGYLREWLKGINDNAGTKAGVVVWHPKGAKIDDSLVLLRAADLAKLLGSAPASDSPPSPPPDIPGDTPPARRG